MLEGKIVRLRPLDAGDLDRDWTWVNDREVTRFLSMRYPISRAEEERWLRDHPPSDFSNGVFFAIETRDGVHIGNLNLFQVNPEDRKASLGIIIGAKECWNRGHGTDAVETLLRFAFGEMNLQRIWLTTLEYNERAQACYRKCGFQEEARLRQDAYRHGRYYDFVVMGVLRDEFEALHGASFGEGERDA